MQHLHQDLGTVSVRATVIVDLAGTEANVLLLDDINYSSYQRRGTYRYYGGHFTRSPARIPVPSTGRWHVAIDLGGAVGSVHASVHVLAA